MDISVANHTTLSWRLTDLSPSTKYKFYVKACTAKGCGKPVTEEGLTVAQGSKLLGSMLFLWRSFSNNGKIYWEYLRIDISFVIRGNKYIFLSRRTVSKLLNVAMQLFRKAELICSILLCSAVLVSPPSTPWAVWEPAPCISLWTENWRCK